MNKKTATVALILVLFLTSIGNVGTQNTGYKVSTIDNSKAPLLSQTVANVSDYYDYILSTGSLVLDNLINSSYGLIYHYSDFNWSSISGLQLLSNYYWAISGLAKIYSLTSNSTLIPIISRVANRMITLFKDPDYPGFYVNLYDYFRICQSKRAGIQAYAYWALDIAESLNSSLDFSAEKQWAIDCLTQMLYDPIYGGFYFYTARNGTLDITPNPEDVYPNDGKRLDHMALGASVLYDAGIETGNTTYTQMADRTMSFIMRNMRSWNQTYYYGLKLATARNGSIANVPSYERPGETVLSDIEAIAIRALVKAYTTTGNSSYLDFALETRHALLKYNWDTLDGGWFEECLLGEPYDPDPENSEEARYYKYSEIQFQVVMALEDIYECTGEYNNLQLIFDTLEISLGLWDYPKGGFIRNGDRVCDILDTSWEIHLTSVQNQAILALERVWSYGLPIVSFVQVAPTNPRPEDEIFIATIVLDSDGVDTVLVNYTVTVNSTDTHILTPLHPNPELGGAYNTSIGFLPDTANVNFFIIANDTLGNQFVAGNYHFTVRKDIWEPVVQFREVLPSTNPAPGDTVIVEFGTYEFPTHCGITCCILYWRLNEGEFTPINMTAVGVDGDFIIWQYVLGSFNVGDEIYLYCTAEDEDSNLGQSRYVTIKVQSPLPTVTPLGMYQLVMIIGLAAAPAGYVGYKYLGRQNVKGEERRLKKEAKKRSRKKRGSRSRSRSS
jgi:hypothetical protein